MEITRTFNSDKRYYLDEDLIINSESLIDTINRFNDIKIQLYNHLYEQRFYDRGILTQTSVATWCKLNFNITDYYITSIYSQASGSISSQTELNRLYIKTIKEEIKTKDRKIKDLKKSLRNKEAIRKSITLYIKGKNKEEENSKEKEWKNPYKGCRTKVVDNQVTAPNLKGTVTIEQYERIIEEDIKSLRLKIKLIEESKKRKQKKLSNKKKNPPRKIVFGSKKFYKKKDTLQTEEEKQKWKEEFFRKRHSSISLSGRHTSKDCNFLVRRSRTQEEKEKYGESALIITCMDNRQVILKDFKLSSHNEDWLNMLSASPDKRRPICYNFTLKTDSKGRMYIIPSVTIVLENNLCNNFFNDGCVSIDLNYDHVAITDIDQDGNRLSGEIIKFNPEYKSHGQIQDEIGRVMSIVGKYCEDRCKPLVMEDINTTISKHGMKYNAPKGNKHASLFAYRLMTSCLENQSYKRGFGIIKINPSYTSQIGKLLYMRKLGLSIHSCASYVIGLKGMELTNLLTPTQPMLDRLTDKLKEEVSEDMDIPTLMKLWQYISNNLKEVPTHFFYKEIPYNHKDPLTKSGKPRKQKSLKAIATEMNNWAYQ